MTRRLKQPANDNQPPVGRRIVKELTVDLPILETELALIEKPILRR
ncbi:MAG: hypothetical protein R3C60_11410 [Parvularculaceae bacterium]